MSRVCVLFCHSSSAWHTSSKYMRIQLLLSKAQTFYGITILWGIFISPRMEPKEHNMISLYTCCIRIFLFLPPCSISRLVSSLSHTHKTSPGAVAVTHTDASTRKLRTPRLCHHVSISIIVCSRRTFVIIAMGNIINLHGALHAVKWMSVVLGCTDRLD